MPPSSPPPSPFTPPAHHPAPQKSTKPKEPIGPVVGAGIIVVVLIIGALYFWGAELNSHPQAPLPLIGGDPVPASQ